MNVIVTQILRPIKLVFLIRPKNKASYIRSINMCSVLWGGRHFPILPFYKTFPSEFREEYRLHETPLTFYVNALDNFDPDFVVIESETEKEHISKITGDRKIITATELEESLISGETKYGISIDEILHFLKDSEFKYKRNDDLRINLSIADNPFIATLFGSSSIAFSKILKDIPFPEELISFPKYTNRDIGALTDNSILHYLDITIQKTDKVGNPFWSGETSIYLLDSTRLHDLIKFWNLRALGWNIIAIPFDKYKEPWSQELIRNHQISFIKNGFFTKHMRILVGPTINEETLHDFIYFVRTLHDEFTSSLDYSIQHWYPRFWLEKHRIDSDRSANILIRSEIVNNNINTNDEQITVPILLPPFNHKYIRHVEPRFVNEIYFEFDDTAAKYAQIIPQIKSEALSMVIRGWGYNQWRFSDNGMHYLAKSRDEVINFYLPKAKDVFEKWFHERGIDIKTSANGNLTYQLFNNVGGIYGTNFFANQGLHPILTLFENGKIVKQSTLFASLSRESKGFEFINKNEVVERLIHKNIIQFGVELQCTLCNHKSFYSLSDFNDILRCNTCHNKFHVPAENPDSISWAYRGIGPFSKNNRSEGIVSVLLTLRFFRISMRPEALTSIMNFDITENEKASNEIDLALFYKKHKNGFSKPDLFFCECKTEYDFAKVDIQRMERLAKLYPGCILVFATLKQKLNPSEIKLLSQFAKRYRKGISERPTNPILILTANELMSFITYDQEFKHLKIPHLDFSDEIGHLCDVTTQHYLGLPSYSTEVHERVNRMIKKKYPNGY